jgi:hypothetical protein
LNYAINQFKIVKEGKEMKHVLKVTLEHFVVIVIIMEEFGENNTLYPGMEIVKYVKMMLSILLKYFLLLFGF